jgi:hypothetical protein
MRQRPFGFDITIRGRILLAVAALSLLAMPVTYSGGAEQPHPHIFFQVWIDAAHNNFEHHHHGDEPRAALHGMTMPATKANAAKLVVGDDGPALSNTPPPETRGQVLAWRTQPARSETASGPTLIDAGEIPLRGLPIAPETPPPRAILGNR